MIKKILEAKFPEVTIHAAHNELEAEPFIDRAEILLTIKISDDLIRKAEKLQWVQSLITGVDPIVNLPSLRKEVLVTSTRGIHGPQMSEIAFLFMLALSRDLFRNFRNQQKKNWERWPGKLLYQKKVGILGVGVIGKALAQKCKAFDMTVYGITRTRRDIDFVDHAFGPEDLPRVMAEVDFFINIVPSTPETNRMVGAKELAVMKPTSFFINIGRGDTVDEEALIDVLKAGKIAGAALDALVKEPLPEESPLWHMDNVIITPHIGGMSDIYIDQALPIFEENLKRYLQGERRDLVNYIEWNQ
jgi:phosphoglycerate dehydrogenase-like enzyme